MAYTVVDLGYATVSDNTDVVSLTTIADAPAGSTVVAIPVGYYPGLGSAGRTVTDGVNTYVTQRSQTSVSLPWMFAADSNAIAATLPTGSTIVGHFNPTSSPGTNYTKTIQAVAILEAVTLFPFPPMANGASNSGSGFSNSPPTSVPVAPLINSPTAPPAAPYLMLGSIAHGSNQPFFVSPTAFAWTAGPNIIKDAAEQNTAWKESSLHNPSTDNLPGTITITPVGGTGVQQNVWIVLTYYGAGASASEISQATDTLRVGKWLMQTDGTDITLNRYVVGSGGNWGAGSPIALAAGTSVSVIRLDDARMSLSYVASGSVKHRYYTTTAGAGTVATVGTGTLVDHVRDSKGRLIFAVYNAGWFIVVGTLDSGGGSWSFSGPTSMGLTATAAKGSLEAHDDGTISFAYITGAGAAAVVHANPVSETGAATWRA